MLWLPNQDTLTQAVRVRRHHWQWRAVYFLVFLFLLFGLGAAAAPPQGALLVELESITAQHRFDFVDWESRSLAAELRQRWQAPALPESAAERRALVQTFLQQEEQLLAAKGELARSYATRTTASLETSALIEVLGQFHLAQSKIQPQVELLLAQQVEAILRDEGFTIAGTVFPPVAFRLVNPPTALIISPRDHIQNQYFVALQPGLAPQQRTEIEAALDQRGDVSSYVTDIGGLGSYPTMVIQHTSLPYLLDTIAHEWTHNYLFTFPTAIAWSYQTDPHLTTINETTASLVGAEVSRKVIARYYPDWLDQLPAANRAGEAVPAKPSEFHLAMRRIRQEVDRLLAGGEIEAAETYMETERLKLVEQGYPLRKLNQAYFAFHGSYALSPGSIDPTGPQIRQLRAVSPSLKNFLDRVGWLNSSEDYTAWLAEAGLN